MTAPPQLQVETTLGDVLTRRIASASSGGAASADRFSQFRFDNADVGNLRRLVGGPSPVVADVFRVITAMGRRPAGAFANIGRLYAQLGLKPGPRPTRLLRNLFIDGVNRRLQSEVYGPFLFAHRPPPNLPHDRKIALFEATREHAEAIVGSYDWDWLADWLQLERIGENVNSCLRRLSNFAFPIHRIDFRFTYHCNIACRHCYNNSGPRQKAQQIPLEPMLQIIAQMPDAGIGYLNLTGGEPFLYPDHLTKLIAAGRVAGLRGISIYSNAFWALDAERAKRTLERLSAAGFMQGPADHLKVSTGVYHQEFIAFSRILTLAPIYHAMFGKPLPVDCELPADGTDLTEQVRSQVRDARLADQIELIFRTITPLGRGKDLAGIATHSIDAPCNAINQIVFDPDGSVRPCCGQNNENEGVIIGRLTDELRFLVKRMQNDPVLQFLSRRPMNDIFDYLDREKDANGYSGVCHLCQDALGGLSDKQALQATLFDQQQFYPFWFTLPGHESLVPFQADEPPDGDD